MENAVKELGIKELHFLDYIDGEVDKANQIDVVDKIVRHIRRMKPQVVVTFPPDGNYGHPDHIASSQYTHAAIICAADSSYTDTQNVPAHRALKPYYMVDGENYVNFICPFLDKMAFPMIDGQLRGEVAWQEWMITTRIEMTDHCAAAVRAIRCHASQLPSLGALPEMHADAAAAILAMQGTFYRAFSLVNAGRRLETDLFEGMRGKEIS